MKEGSIRRGVGEGGVRHSIKTNSSKPSGGGGDTSTRNPQESVWVTGWGEEGVLRGRCAGFGGVCGCEVDHWCGGRERHGEGAWGCGVVTVGVV